MCCKHAGGECKAFEQTGFQGGLVEAEQEGGEGFCEVIEGEVVCFHEVKSWLLCYKNSLIAKVSRML